MSKSSELDLKVKLYLLSIIDNEGFEDCKYFREFKTNQDKIDFLKARFESEYQWNIDRIGQQNACREWLQSLAIDIEYMNHKILDLAIEWGSLNVNHSDKEAYKIISSYFNFMAAKLCQLFNGYRIPKGEMK